MGWRIGELLVQKKWITWNQLEDALQVQKDTRKLLGEVLVEKNWLRRYYVYQALGEQNNISFVDLPRTRINPRAVDLLPMDFALKHTLIPIEICAGNLILGIASPLNSWPEAEIKQLTGMVSIQTVLCLPEHIRKAIDEEYGRIESAAVSSNR